MTVERVPNAGEKERRTYAGRWFNSESGKINHRWIHGDGTEHLYLKKSPQWATIGQEIEFTYAGGGKIYVGGDDGPKIIGISEPDSVIAAWRMADRVAYDQAQRLAITRKRDELDEVLKPVMEFAAKLPFNQRRAFGLMAYERIVRNAY